MLIVRGVNLFPSQIEEQVLRCPELAPHFEMELTRPDRLDVVRVRVETRADGEAASAAARLVRYVKEVVGVSVVIELSRPGSLERSAGKARRVYDLR